MKNNRVLLLHDLSLTSFLPGQKNYNTISCLEISKPCIGCFGCWTKNPGFCVIKDGFEEMSLQLAGCDQLIIVSQCLYGGFSVPVKNILDRSIGYILPFFTIRSDKQMHHAERYRKQLSLQVRFYGSDLTLNEKQTAQSLVKRNALNFNAAEYTVSFYRDQEEIRRLFV